MITHSRQSVNIDDRLAVDKVLKGDWLTTGPNVLVFEKAFAKYVGSKYAVAVSSGTAALHVAYMAAGLNEEDEVITTPITFPATSNAVLYCNAKVIFADVKYNCGLIDPDKINSLLSQQTKIIVPVHYTGQPVDLEKIHEMATKKNILVVEDACQAHGATYKDSKIGDCRYSDMCCFSFHPVKNMTTGEGGMITTNSEKYYEHMLALRAHGMVRDKDKYHNKNEGPWHFEMHCLGYNYRLTDFQSALGTNQLSKLDQFVKRRQELAGRYDIAFENHPLITPLKQFKDRTNPYHLYVVRVKEHKRELFDYLKERDILCQVHHIPVHYHPYYQQLGFRKGTLPVAEGFYEDILTLPLHTELTDEDQNKVIMEVNNFFNDVI